MRYRRLRSPTSGAIPKSPDAKVLQKLIHDVGSDTFRTRERAHQDLSKYGDLAAAAFTQALKETSILETRRRLESLLARLNVKRQPSLEELRTIRAV